MSELEYCAFCDGGYAHSGICDKCATEIGQTGKELADKDRQLAEARVEIERKDRLIEQMREAIKFSLIADEVRQTRNVCASDINDACETSKVKRIAALAAEGSE